MIEIKSSQAPVSPAELSRLQKCWQKVLSRPEIGFSKIPENQAEWTAVIDRHKQCRPAKHVLVLGIGGSSLGVQTIYQALRKPGSPQFTFLESPDPMAWDRLGGMQSPEWQDKHVIIVSKSGNTLETLSWVERLQAHDPQWLKNSQCTVIASPGEGPLQKWARREGLPTLWIPTNVGGRFSVLTAVGLLPAALMGLDLERLRAGAAWALQNPGVSTQLAGDVLASWKREEWITQHWTYSDGLQKFGEWWQQLWGESLAKKLDRAGKPASRASTPMPCLGPRDQHSLVQQLIEGARDKFTLVTRVRALEADGATFKTEVFPEMPFAGAGKTSLGQILGAEAEAFTRSLRESGIAHSTLTIERLDEAAVGALFMLWQMCIAQLGESLEIDAFNQPGVELGKKFAHAILMPIG